MNRLYEVRRYDNLNTTDGVTVTNLTGSGIPMSLLIPTAGVPQRFSRIVAH